jgi:hypothetical protein
MVNQNSKFQSDYKTFFNWVEELVSIGKTSGLKQSQQLSEFTALNYKRMERLNRTVQLNANLLAITTELEQAQKWILITEAWCGDSAQNLPLISKIAESNPEMIQLQIILRDENADLMEKYNTNGSKSIPKLIAFDTEGKELFTWGPRPSFAQQMMIDWKANKASKSYDEFEKELHTWYAKDKSQSLQNEFYELLLKYS